MVDERVGWALRAMGLRVNRPQRSHYRCYTRYFHRFDGLKHLHRHVLPVQLCEQRTKVTPKPSGGALADDINPQQSRCQICQVCLVCDDAHTASATHLPRQRVRSRNSHCEYDNSSAYSRKSERYAVSLATKNYYRVLTDVHIRLRNDLST